MNYQMKFKNHTFLYCHLWLQQISNITDVGDLSSDVTLLLLLSSAMQNEKAFFIRLRILRL